MKVPNFDDGERSARRLLLVLLGLNLLLRILPDCYPTFSGLRSLTGLLPYMALAWGMFRGSWPALALVCIATLSSVGNLIGLLQFGGTAALNSTTALFGIQVLGRATLLGAVFFHADVSRYWSLCQVYRTRRDLIVEIAVFVGAAVLSLVL